jgi:hypothetical protein
MTHAEYHFDAATLQVSSPFGPVEVFETVTFTFEANRDHAAHQRQTAPARMLTWLAGVATETLSTSSLEKVPGTQQPLSDANEDILVSWSERFATIWFQASLLRTSQVLTFERAE